MTKCEAHSGENNSHHIMIKNNGMVKLIFVVMLRYSVDGLGHLTSYHENYFFQNLIQPTNIQPKFSNQFKYISF